MKKILSILLAFSMLLALTGCGGSAKKASVTEEDANQYLTEFFASYSKMNDYLKNKDIAISAFALDGQGLSSILKAVYQAQSVSYIFPTPTRVADNVFSVQVEVTAPNIQPLYEMYSIDRQFLEEDYEGDFVAQSFYDNICTGTTNDITTTVNVTLRYNGGTWYVDPNNDLAFAVFPNIDKAS